MNRIAKFEKVTLEQFSKDFKNLNPNSTLSDSEIDEMYNSIKMPARATKMSAGYDFYLPYAIELDVGNEIVIPTGIRSKIQEDWALLIMPKSGLGTKSRLIMYNTAGLIDADYYNSDNQGHILVKLLYDLRNSDKHLSLPAGKSFVQGFFFPFKKLFCLFQFQQQSLFSLAKCSSHSSQNLLICLNLKSQHLLLQH